MLKRATNLITHNDIQYQETGYDQMIFFLRTILVLRYTSRQIASSPSCLLVYSEMSVMYVVVSAREAVR